MCLVMEPTPVTMERPPVHVRKPLALFNNKLTFERKLVPLKSPFNQPSSFRSSQANKVVLIGNQSQHEQSENISSQEQVLLPSIRLSQSNNVVITINQCQPEQSGNTSSQQSSGPSISQSNAFKLPSVHSRGVGMDESNCQQNWSATKDTAAEEIKASKHFKLRKDIVATAKEHQSKKSKSNPAPVRDKITRNKFEAAFKKPSVRSMNTSAVEMPKCLEDILPSCFEYVVTYFDQKEDGGFSTIFRTNVGDKDGALRWIDMFQETSFDDLRSHNTFKENSPRIIFKKVYRCHCDTRADEPGSKTKTPHSKHTVCPANLIITVKNQEMKRSGDAHLKTFPCEITLNYLHNHGIVRADSLRFRRPTPEVKEAFLELFKKGHSPSSALNSIKFDLQLKYGDDYYKHAANGAICPSYKWGYNLYYCTFRQKYGDASGDGMISSLTDFVHEYNKSCGSECAKLAVEGSDVAVAICSPLMKRVHELLRSSGEITFVDSSGNMDFANTRVFIFNTASVAGGLPLGIVFTTSEATYPLTNAFKLLQDILPEQAFFGRGKDGPKIFMTDDSQTERSSLRATFKASDLVLLLCKFHVLQAIWRFLLDSSHEVKGADRVELFFLYKQLLNCTDIKEFNDMYEEFLKLSIVERNRKFKEHIEKKRESAKEWAMAHRQDIMTRGHDTNNYNEVCTKRVKEDILQRVKAYSMVQLFDFMTVSLDAYFKRKLADCLSNRMTNYRSSRYFIDDSKLESLTATQLTDDVFSVHNSESGKTYRVELTVDLCSCPIGVNGKPCKHQYYVVKSLGRSSSQFLPLNDPESKLILHQIMNGSCSDIPEGWYESHKTSVNHGTNTSEDILEQEMENQPMQEENREETTIPINAGHIGASPTNDEESRLSKLRHEIDKMHEDMLKRLDERPEVYLPAMEKFMERYEECSQSENTYLSGLFTFNRSRNQGHAPLKGWAMKRIPVQPTAVGRRTTYLGGRHAKIPGRPSAAFKAANALKRRALEPNYANLPQKKRRLKHNISKNVLRNVPLSQLN